MGPWIRMKHRLLNDLSYGHCTLLRLAGGTISQWEQQEAENLSGHWTLVIPPLGTKSIVCTMKLERKVGVRKFVPFYNF